MLQGVLLDIDYREDGFSWSSELGGHIADMTADANKSGDGYPPSSGKTLRAYSKTELFKML